MESFEIRQQIQNDVCILEIHGYFNDLAGKALSDIIRDKVSKGQYVFLLDFRPCPVINSPGVSALLDLALSITEDYQGQLLICGLDRVKYSVLEMAGINSMAIIANDVAEAITKYKSMPAQQK